MKKSNSILVAALIAAMSSSAFAANVTPFQGSIAEETFQTEIVNRALAALGHDVDSIKEVDYAVAYKQISQEANSDDISFMAVNWAPLHDAMYDKVGGDKVFYRKGHYVEGAAQGYLIDKKTADQYNIKYINDLKDPKIAKLFDHDGDGKADLAGCNPGWGCEKVIEHQLDAFGLRDTVEHNQGSYSAVISETITNYKQGKPVVYYTWTPYWVSGILKPGKDVTWLQVTKSAHPITKDTSLPNGANYGFNVNSMRIVANKSVAKNHPEVAKLFSVMKLSVNDVSAQNQLIKDGQGSPADIKRHVDSWIKANQKTFDGWIAQAKAAK